MFIRVARQRGVVGLNVQLEVVVQSIVFQESYDTHSILVNIKKHGMFNTMFIFEYMRAPISKFVFLL